MKRIIITTIICLIAIAATGTPRFKINIFNKVKLGSNDIPSGFIVGKVPPGVKKVLKNNPWNMDRPAIRRLSRHIYPGGDYNKIMGIHMTILANAKQPYGDDIVCYCILFRDEASTRDEVKKLKDFVGFNKDRAIIIEKDNLAVYLHVDSTVDFHHIQNLAEKIKDRIE